ncbi:5-formyltetrahydrofolate cyclo-ligase [Limimaricola soesokkakensis]|uniref:5-formyltetrahydrofolate cyclo-ligase n=1 Tax=Limimaricola soesokkakensis TaxID=1343159 RepID=UPI003516045C
MHDDDVGGSEPCFAHHLVGGHPVDLQTAKDVARFRRAERQRLVAARGLTPDERAHATEALIEGLDRIIGIERDVDIAVYWPIRGEPDLRPWMHRAHAAGARISLPVVVEARAPLAFHAWMPGCQMTRGIWNIPVPAKGAISRPDIIVAPLVGADRANHRLGNGGGYYDRSLGEMAPRPRSIGVGFEGCLLPTIFPMPWDVPLDEILLSGGTYSTR